MKRSIRFGSMFAIAATAALMSSCSKGFDFYDPVQDVTQKYSQSWKETFGEIDSNQDWNLATQKIVNINVEGTKTVQILTGNPYLNEGKLAGSFTVTGRITAKVDLSKDTEVIYVVQRNEDGTKDVRTTRISEDGTFNTDFTAAPSATRAATRAGSRTATEISTVVRSTPYASGLYCWKDEWNNYHSLWDDATTTKKYNNWGDKYYYVADNAQQSNVNLDQTLMTAINEIVPENKKTSYYNTIIKDVDLVVSEEGPVTLTCAGATTSNAAAIGYYIYTNKAVDNTDMACPDYLTEDWLMENGYTGQYPGYKIEQRTGVTDPQKLADKFILIPNVQNVKPSQSGDTYSCNTYKLLYKDANGNVSETFPKGTKISFFVVPNANCKDATYIDAQRTVFSFADMNVDAHRTNVDYGYYTGFDATTYATSHAATFKVQDKIVIGFEDAPTYNSQDFDYNDCVFIIDGNFDEDIIPDPIPSVEPKPNAWIIACEDLGSTDDYDFNDVVFEVKHVSGETTATVTPLAAGGVYASHITYDYGTKEFGETHELLGSSVGANGLYPMINTTSITATGTPQTITVDTDFSVAKDMGGFGIRVNTGTSLSAILISAPSTGTAPQMFCVPATWSWPKERIRIEEAYPSFSNWSADSNDIEWYNSPADGKTIR